MVEQFGGPFTGRGGRRPAGLIGGEELHQGGGDLLGGTAGTLGLEAVPVPVLDRQPALQLFGQFQGSLRPVADVALGGGLRRGWGWHHGRAAAGASHPDGGEEGT